MNYKEITELSKHQNIRAINKIARADARKRDFRTFKFFDNLFVTYYFNLDLSLRGYDITCELSRAEIKAIKIYMRAYKLYKEFIIKGQ